MKKEKRQNLIRQLILDEKISSQHNLSERLFEKGVRVTQATLSRDLKQLKIIKTVHDDGTYTYSFPENEASNSYKPGLPMSGNAFLGVRFSKNIAVVKTLPGFAPGLASSIDRLRLNTVIGTVAGDDTIFIVIAEDVTIREFRSELLEKVPDLAIRINL